MLNNINESFLLDFKYYVNTLLGKFFKYFINLSLFFHNNLSLFGFMLLLIISNQIISGIMLSFSLLPEPMLIPVCREEEDSENLYTDDFFWLHERGVDLFFLLLVIHLFRKFFIIAYHYEQELAWKSGVMLFLLGHGVIFFGLVLCCTHLSEITLTIAANILHTIFFFKGKMYWWLFTDMLLNTDTLIRLAYIHYILAFIVIYLGILHGIEMHYDWRGETYLLALDLELNWWWEALNNELGQSLNFLLLLFFINVYLYGKIEPLSYEIFMWGDIGIVTDVRFYGVAPHWYFRPYMAWLIVCPYHKMGLGGLFFFFLILYFQPNFFKNIINTNIQYNFLYLTSFFFFIFFLFYTTTFLPYGRFYNQIGGNNIMLFSYLFVFIYLGTTIRVINFNNSFTYILFYLK